MSWPEEERKCGGAPDWIKPLKQEFIAEQRISPEIADTEVVINDVGDKAETHSQTCCALSYLSTFKALIYYSSLAKATTEFDSF